MSNARSFQESVIKAITRNPTSIVLDCEHNESIEVPALQTLLALYKHSAENGIDIRWHSPSIALLQQTEELGLSESLGL